MGAVVAVPAYVLASTGTLETAIVSQALLALALGMFFGPAGPAFVELFPARTRYTGASISYNLAFTIFGGTAPLLAVWLVEQFGGSAFALCKRRVASPSRYLRAEHLSEPLKPPLLERIGPFTHAPTS